jgi:hypothetical protein
MEYRPRCARIPVEDALLETALEPRRVRDRVHALLDVDIYRVVVFDRVTEDPREVHLAPLALVLWRGAAGRHAALAR